MSESAGLTLFLPYPPTANNLFPTGKSGRRFISAEYKAWKHDATLSLWGQRVPVAGIGRASVVYEFRRPDNRRRDAFNLEKPVTDLLVEYGVLRDDSLIEEGTVRWVRDVPWEVRATVRSVP